MSAWARLSWLLKHLLGFAVLAAAGLATFCAYPEGPLYKQILVLGIGSFVAQLVVRDRNEWSSRNQRPSVYGRHFTPKYRFSTQNNPLCAIPLPAFIKLLWQRREYIDWQVYWFRLFFLLFMSGLQSSFGLVEHILHGAQIDKTKVNERPVFVIGHPRTGTTHMFNLLALNKAEFSHTTTFNVGFPLSYIWFEKYRHLLGNNILSEKRPMDNMALNWESPQEDELATNVLTSGLSPYMCISIMRGAEQFYDYFDFQKPEVAEQKREWTSVFKFVLQKLQYASNLKAATNPEVFHKNRRLLLKSPVHTSRIQLILQLFPKAQFIYMHRDPVDVFASAANMADTTYWYSFLNVPTDDEILDFIISQYRIMMDQYIRDRELIPKGNLVEVAFADLAKEPEATIRTIYNSLGWTGSYDAHLKGPMQEYLASKAQKTYKRNKFNTKSLSPALRKRLAEEWKLGFEAFGYPLIDTSE